VPSVDNAIAAIAPPQLASSRGDSGTRANFEFPAGRARASIRSTHAGTHR